MVLEDARKFVHLCSCLAAVIIYQLIGQELMILFLCMVILLGIFALFISPMGVEYLRRILDRDESFMGRGSFLLVLGLLGTVILFPQQFIASALVLGVSDSVATFFSGKKKIPRTNASYRGSAAFFVSSAAILWFFSSWWLVLSVVLTALEALKLGVDDNLSIPLLTGALLFVLG